MEKRLYSVQGQIQKEHWEIVRNESQAGVGGLGALLMTGEQRGS